MKGNCSFYTRVGGYGFILSNNPDAPDFFVHYSFIEANSAQRFLKVGQAVEFNPVQDAKGRWQARNVKKLADAPPSGGCK